MQHDNVLVRLNFDLLTSSPRNVCVCLGMEGMQAKYLLPCWGLGVQAKHLLRCCCNLDSLKFDMHMQHDVVLKKIDF